MFGLKKMVRKCNGTVIDFSFKTNNGGKGLAKFIKVEYYLETSEGTKNEKLLTL